MSCSSIATFAVCVWDECTGRQPWLPMSPWLWWEAHWTWTAMVTIVTRAEERGGVQLAGPLAIHVKELERNNEVGVTSPSCRLNHKQIMAFYQQQSSQCDVSPSLLSAAQCLAFSAAQGEQHGESSLFRGRQVTVLSLLAWHTTIPTLNTHFHDPFLRKGEVTSHRVHLCNSDRLHSSNTLWEP